MIDARDLVKRYGALRALDGLTLSVERGELVGLVGPNGAGKSTLIKILATLVHPDAGAAAIDGFDVVGASGRVRALVGYMPDVPGLYQDMRVRELLEFFADAFRLRGARRRAAVEGALARAGLADRADTFVEALSLGLKQSSPRPCCTRRGCCCSTSPPPAWTRWRASSCAGCCVR